jgi:hypothetical protein
MTKHNATWSDGVSERDEEWVKENGEWVLKEDDEVDTHVDEDVDGYYDYNDDDGQSSHHSHRFGNNR